jgi:hypothetical protein
VDRTVRFLKLWHGMVGPAGANLMAAGEHKWNAVAAVTWLGSTLAVSLGLLWIPRDKRLCAVVVEQACTGPPGYGLASSTGRAV